MATTKYHDAARDGNVDLLRKMSRRDANKQDEDGLTTTCYAAYAGNLAALRACIGRGGDPDICTFYGSTPLHLAAQGGNLNCVSLLVNFGCNLWTLDNDHRSALDVAAAHEQMDIVRYLDEQLAAQAKDNPLKVNKLKQRALIAADDRIKEFEKRQKRASAHLGRHLKKQEKAKRTNDFSAFAIGAPNEQPVVKVRHRTQSNPPPCTSEQQHTLLARGRLPLALPKPFALSNSLNIVAANGYGAALHSQLEALRLRQSSVQSSSPLTAACENDYESIHCNESLTAANATKKFKIHTSTTSVSDSNRPQQRQSSLSDTVLASAARTKPLAGIRSRANKHDVLYVSKFSGNLAGGNNNYSAPCAAARTVFGLDSKYYARSSHDAESGVSSSSTSYRTDSGFGGGGDDATSLFDRRGFGEIVFRPSVLDATCLAALTSKTPNALTGFPAPRTTNSENAGESANKIRDKLPTAKIKTSMALAPPTSVKHSSAHVAERTSATAGAARQSRSLLPKTGTYRSSSSHNSSHLYELSWSVADIGDLDDFDDESETEMRMFLHANGLGDYIAAFERERLDLDTLMQLEDNDMIQLGIPLGHRKKLTSAIASRRAELRQ